MRERWMGCGVDKNQGDVLDLGGIPNTSLFWLVLCGLKV